MRLNVGLLNFFETTSGIGHYNTSAVYFFF